MAHLGRLWLGSRLRTLTRSRLVIHTIERPMSQQLQTVFLRWTDSRLRAISGNRLIFQLRQESRLWTRLYRVLCS